jgi:hypothetical protein
VSIKMIFDRDLLGKLVIVVIVTSSPFLFDIVSISEH